MMWPFSNSGFQGALFHDSDYGVSHFLGLVFTATYFGIAVTVFVTVMTVELIRRTRAATLNSLWSSEVYSIADDPNAEDVDLPMVKERFKLRLDRYEKDLKPAFTI